MDLFAAAVGIGPSRISVYGETPSTSSSETELEVLGDNGAGCFFDRYKEEGETSQASYKQFCPIAMAAEVLCTRRTVVLLRELVAGSTRFNDPRRGVPRMSPALLSQRLKDLESADIVERIKSRTERGIHEYQLRPAGRDLRPVVESVGFRGQKWIEAQLSLRNLDPSLLIWDMRRNLDMSPMPERRS